MEWLQKPSETWKVAYIIVTICHLSTLSFRDRVVTSERVLNIDDGTAEFGWGPEDPVEKGQLQLLGWSRNLPVGGPFFFLISQ